MKFSDKDFGKITVRVNVKAKNVVFRILPGELRITVPPFLSEKELPGIIEKHRSALNLQMKKIKPATVLDESFELQTHRFSVSIFKTERADFYFSRKNGVLYIACPQTTNFEQDSVRNLLITGIEKYLKADAIAILPKRLKDLADMHNLTYSEVKINSSKSRWGSCSGRKSINLSFYSMLLPPHLIDYLLLHELTHTLEMNHSSRFWAELDRFTGNRSKELREELKRFKTSI